MFPGLPYGTYTVCADNNSASTPRRYPTTGNGVTQTNFLRSGVATPVNLPVPTSGTPGAPCP